MKNIIYIVIAVIIVALLVGVVKADSRPYMNESVMDIYIRDEGADYQIYKYSDEETDCYIVVSEFNTGNYPVSRNTPAISCVL